MIQNRSEQLKVLHIVAESQRLSEYPEFSQRMFGALQGRLARCYAQTGRSVPKPTRTQRIALVAALVGRDLQSLKELKGGEIKALLNEPDLEGIAAHLLESEIMSDEVLQERLNTKSRMVAQRRAHYGKPLCDLCHLRLGTQMHEWIPRSATVKQPELRKLSFDWHICSLVCQHCHDVAETEDNCVILIVRNVELFNGKESIIRTLEAIPERFWRRQLKAAIGRTLRGNVTL